MEVAKPRICFFGPKMFFSDALCAAVTEELVDCNIYRSTSLDDGDGNGTKAILTPLGLVTDLAGFTEDAVRYAPKAHIALLYDDIAAARSFFAAHGEKVLHAGISLAPMNVRLDVWLLFIRLFLLGQEYRSSELSEAMDGGAKQVRLKAAREAVGRLTRREDQILALAARGAQNKEIAEQLAISEHTVKLHMHHVVRKMNVRNRTEASHLFLQIAGMEAGGRPNQ